MASTGCSLCDAAMGRKGAVLWEDALWTVVHKRPPCGVVGHLMCISKRHFQGPSAFTDEEAATIGPTLRQCEKALEKVTQCDRVYTAALGSPKAPHFHAHMIPMYANADGAFGKPATAWTGTPFDVFLQEKLAADGKEGVAADAAQCSKVAEAFAAEMARAVGEAPPGKRPKGDEPPRRCAAVLFDLDE